MNDQPLVSVVIPCFNSEEYIADAINSALRQTYQNIEVIVVDDGSTDASLDLIKSFGDKVRWMSGTNEGGNVARNKGIEIASGEFIQLLDADDLLEPDKVAIHLDALNDSALTNGSGQDEWLTCVKGKAVDFATNEELDKFEWPDDDYVRWVVMSSLPILAPLHRRDKLLEIGGFEPGLPCCQEKDLHLRLLKNGVKFIQLPSYGYVIKKRKDSVSANSLGIYKQLRDVLWSTRPNPTEQNEREANLRRLYSQALTNTGRQLWKQGAKGEALVAFKRAKQVNGGKIELEGASFSQRMKIVFLGWLATVTSALFRMVNAVRRLMKALLFYFYNHFLTNVPGYWIRAAYLRWILRYKIASGTAVHMGSFFTGEQVRVGKNCVLNRRCTLDGRGGLEIGDNVSISAEVYVITATHVVDDPDFRGELRPVRIEDFVWIGARAIILPGVVLAVGSVVAAGAVVTKSTEPWTVVGGNPAKVIRKREPVARYNLRYFPWLDTDIDR